MVSILQRIANGEQDAVGACVDEYGDLIWRLARRYLCRSDGEVEDAVQEVFVELWLSAGRFNPERGSEPAFVATIAHRRLTDYQRRVVARRKHESRAIERPRQISDYGAPLERDQARRVAKEFDALPEEERAALWMATYQGLTQSQISTATGAPIGTVKSRVRRGMIRICDALSRPEPAVGAQEARP